MPRPPNIHSAGERPTGFGDANGRGVNRKAGELSAEQQLRHFLEPDTQYPSELLAEQKDAILRPGDVVAGRFKVIEQLGFGGMGAVYRVEDQHLGGDKALKVMLPSLLANPKAREKFFAEIRILQNLRHDAIVTVYDLGSDPDRNLAFFVMEFVPGKTLSQYIHEHGGALPTSNAIGILHQLCDALSYAHQYTIHRDLKPQNIIIQPNGRVKILDFGLAKAIQSKRIQASSMALKTIYYQAPEQSVHLTEADRRADIYSLGVLLYQMLTGEIPVGRFHPPSTLRRGLTKNLDDLVVKCLDPDPAQRFQSAEALGAALQQVVAKKPASAQKAWGVLFCFVFICVTVFGAYWFSNGFSQSERTEPPMPLPTPENSIVTQADPPSQVDEAIVAEPPVAAPPAGMELGSLQFMPPTIGLNWNTRVQDVQLSLKTDVSPWPEFDVRSPAGLRTESIDARTLQVQLAPLPLPIARTLQTGESRAEFHIEALTDGIMLGTVPVHADFSTNVESLTVITPWVAQVGVPFPVHLTTSNPLDRSYAGTLAMSVEGCRPLINVEGSAAQLFLPDQNISRREAPRSIPIPASHPLVEIYELEWAPGESKMLSCEITFQSSGAAVLYVRSTFGLLPTEDPLWDTPAYRGYEINIPSEGPVDQQNYPCQTYTIEVVR